MVVGRATAATIGDRDGDVEVRVDRSGSDRRYASIMRMRPDGSGLETFAEGVRNTVGFTWHPRTNALWFTDNGRDMLGDDVPPDELNRAPTRGLHFGFPYFHGESIPDPDFSAGHTASDYVEPAMPLGLHVAARGMRFYTGTMFPEPYRNQIFIAEHGSWNRSDPLGARVMLVRLNAAGDAALSYEVFAEGWQRPDGSRFTWSNILANNARLSRVQLAGSDIWVAGGVASPANRTFAEPRPNIPWSPSKTPVVMIYLFDKAMSRNNGPKNGPVTSTIQFHLLDSQGQRTAIYGSCGPTTGGFTFEIPDPQ